jgi:tetratricopeptide (TPR) repeat protein
MKNHLTLLATVACLAACTTTGSSSNAQPSAPSPTTTGATPAFQAPIDLIPSALGPHAWKITSDSERAQAYFDQGLQLRYAFVVNDAARSFREARLADPQCAMCFWGEAFALGSFLNGAMSAAKAPHAHAAIEKAVALADTVTDVERALILAARVRYPEDYDSEKRRADNEAFAGEMAQVYEQYPDHHEVAVVYAVSLFLLEERRGYRDLDDPDLIRLHGVLAKVLEEDVKHPGACHLYVHATESSQSPDLALACADYLGSSIPVASHIQHMPSHTWNEVGLWGRSVRANIAAVQSDKKAAQGQGFSYAPSHNLHMLLFAASFDGQGAVAIQAGKDYRKLTNNSMYEALTLVRFGRFDEVLGMDNRPANEVSAAMWNFAYGYASLKENDTATAKAMRDNILEFASTTDKRFRFHPASQVVGTVAHLLEGEILVAEGDLDGAIAAFERAAGVEDSMDYDEPEPLPFAARHWLGAALMEAGRFSEAEEKYRLELEDHPHDVWSLHGLRAALAAQDKVDATVEEDFSTSTARTDTWIQASRF